MSLRCRPVWAHVGHLMATLFVGLFLWFFLGQALPSKWEETFVRFHVPAAAFPGWDARNIQMAAHCLKAGVDPFSRQDCIRSGELLKRLHPQGEVPGYNYPIWWARAYAWFDDDSEEFFLRFWRFNALALTAAVGWLCWRHSLWLLPVLLLNPVTLLTIERGNVDGITFAVALSGWMCARCSGASRLFGVMAASILKVYPLLGLLAMWPMPCGLREWPSRVMALLLLASFCVTALNLPAYVEQTTQGYPYSYGLRALSFAPASSGMGSWCAHVGAIALMSIVTVGLPRIKAWRDGVQAGIQAHGTDEALRFLVFMGIYLGTFLLFVNWAYRLIFLYPVFVSAMSARGWPLRLFGTLIGLMLWSPWLANGWELQTCLAYPVAGMAMALLWVGIKGGAFLPVFRGMNPSQ